MSEENEFEVIVLDEPKVEKKEDDIELQQEPVEVKKQEPEPDAALEAANALKEHVDRNKKLEDELKAERVARVQAETKVSKVELNAHEKQLKSDEELALKDKENYSRVLKSSIKEAAEFQANGEFEKAEEIRLAAWEAKQKLDNADKFLRQVDEYRKNPQTQDKNEVKDPVTGNVFTPKTQEWINKHNNLWQDADFRADAAGADTAARARGLQPDTDAYFAFCEKRLGINKEEQEQKQELQAEVEKPKVQNRAPTAAPTRSVPNAPQRGNRVVKLTAEQRAVAHDIVNSAPELFKGMSPEQVYAQAITQLENEHGKDWETSYGR